MRWKDFFKKHSDAEEDKRGHNEEQEPDIFDTTIHHYYFNIGIVAKYDSQIEYAKLLAHLFLSPKYSCEHVKTIIEKLRADSISETRAEEIVKETSAEIADLRAKIAKGEIYEPMKNKLEQWQEYFGAPTASDYAYLEKEFGISKYDLRCLTKPKVTIESAEQMADMVKQYVKGQDSAVEILAVPFFQHICSKMTGKRSPINSSVILIGQTGVGKSEILRRFGEICESCNCPLFRINSNDIMPNGWRGTSLTQSLAQVVFNGNYSQKELKYAVIIVHEFDKVFHYKTNKVGEKTDYDFDMMRDFMRVYETDHPLKLEDPRSDFMKSAPIYLPTENLLIVYDGAFVGLEEIVNARLGRTSIGGMTQNCKQIGFTTYRDVRENKAVEEYVNTMKNINESDLETFGFIPELIGRIGQICVLNPLTPEVIKDIMVGVDDSEYHKHINYLKEQFNTNLCFTEGALGMITDLAAKSGYGFRYVKTLLNKCLNPIYFKIKHHEEVYNVEIDEKYLASVLGLEAQIGRRL